jgi:hypothetical protein
VIQESKDSDKSDLDSSDYESKSEVSEKNIIKARGGNNALYMD